MQPVNGDSSYFEFAHAHALVPGRGSQLESDWGGDWEGTLNYPTPLWTFQFKLCGAGLRVTPYTPPTLLRIEEATRGHSGPSEGFFILNKHGAIR